MTLNTFRLENEKGFVEFASEDQIYSCTVLSNQGAITFAGQPYFIVPTVVGEQIIVTHSTVVTQPTFGFQIQDVKRDQKTGGDQIRIATSGAVVTMEASGAIDRGADLEIVPTGIKVAVAATGNAQIIGISLDRALANGDLIRVRITARFSAGTF